MTRPLSAFRRNERGAVSVLLIMLVTLLVFALMLALDSARLYLLQNRLEAAVYAGAMAGGSAAHFVAHAESLEALEQGETKVEVVNVPRIEDAARRFFRANFPDGFMGAEIQGPQVGQVYGGPMALSIVAEARWQGLMGRLLHLEPTVLKAEYPIIRYGKDLPVVSGKIRLR